MRTLFLTLVAAAVSWAQPLNPAQRYELFQKNLAERASAITAGQFQGIANLEQWKLRRPEIKRQFLEMIGLHPMPARTPLKARITGAFERQDYRVENIVFESSPGLYVTGNLYLPKSKPKAPAVIYVTGHSPSPDGAKITYQHHGVWFAQNGFAAFVLDTIEFGEISGLHHGLHNLAMYNWLSLGYNPTGVEVWNAIRALDYLESRPEIDARNAGITGRSGGGAVSWFTAAADDRFRVAAPVHGTWSIGPHVAHDTVQQNCDCIYFWNTYQIDLPLVGALIAPRPLRIVNATKDGAFPPTGYRPVFECLRPVYQWYGVPEALTEYEEETGHVDNPGYRKAANEWLNRWMRNDTTPYREPQFDRETAAALRVLKTLPADARNEGIHRSFLPLPKLSAPSTAAAWNTRKTALTQALRAQVYRAFPKTKQPFDVWKAEHKMWTQNYADSFRVQFTTESNIRVHGELFVPRDAKARQRALIYLKGKDDIVFSVDYDHLLSALSTHVVLVINPRAVDYPMTNFRFAATQMTAALLGATVESMQLWDALRSVDFLLEQEKLPLNSISLYGRKAMGGLALHAAAIDPRITRVILDDPPGSHWQGPPLLNVLRITDLAEVAGMVAPREIVSLTPLPEPFRLTSAIYKLFGASPRQADSLGQALRVWEQ
ncbi:MAG: acetylxylan esterase [Bryobacterales bacterium]|nr:acetylxylan esterase [Bryobacterales bacterium]